MMEPNTVGVLNHTKTAPSNPRIVSSFEAMFQAGAVAIILVGCLVLAGRTLDIGILKSGWLGLAAMKASTAVALPLAGASLRLLRTG